jgi:phage gp29-like protein
VLKKMGKDISAYEEIKADGYVRGCVKSRKAGVLGMLHGIDRGKAKSRQGKIIEDLFKNLDMPGAISEILDACQFGYSPLEIIWEQVGGYWLPKEIIGKPREWFCYDDENKLCLRERGSYIGAPVPPYKFLCARQEPTYSNPYGFADLSCCFWPATFKKGGLKSWLIFAEKWGQVFAIGKQPRGVSSAESQKLLDSLETMVQDAIAVIPDDSSVELKESAGKAASGGLYKDLMQVCKAEISVVQLGHEGGALSTPGKLGDEGNATAVRDDIVSADQRIVEQTMKELIAGIWDLNFTGPRPTWSLWREEDIDTRLADRDERLMRIGVRFNPEYISESYDIPLDQFTIASPAAPGFDSAQPQAKNPAQFAEQAPSLENVQAGQAVIDKAIEELSPEELQAQADGLLKPVIDLVNASDDLNSIMENLSRAFPQMDSTALQQMVERAIFISELLGKAAAK